MKRFILLSSLILAVVATAAVTTISGTGKTTVSGTGKTTVLVGGPTLILNEGFEGVGAPTGWSGAGGGDFDSTASPLAGAQSLRCADGTSVTSPSDSESEIYHKYTVRVSALPAVSEQLIRIRKSDESDIVDLTLKSDGTLQIYDLAAQLATTVSALSAATAYDVEIRYKKGSGADGIVSVGFVAAGGAIPTAGNAFAGVTNSSRTDNAWRFQYFGSGGVTNTDVDTVKTSISFIP